MPQVTLNPAFDGDVDRILEATWAAAHDTADGENTDTTSTVFQTRGEFNGSTYNLTRSFMSFLLDTVPANATITGATLDINVLTTNAVDAAHGTLHIVEGTPASATALAVTDYDNIGSTNFADTVDGSSTGAKTFTFVAAGIAYLQSKIGTHATIVMRQKKDFDNTQPTGLGTPSAGTVDNGTPSNRPLLTVTFTTPSGDIGSAYFM